MRILTSAPATLVRRLAAPDADGVTVDVFDRAGNQLLAAAVAVDVEGAEGPGEVWKVDLPAVDVPDDLDLLTVTWNAGQGHVETEQVEVVGALYAPVSALRRRPGLSSETTHPDYALDHALALVEEQVEDFCDVSFIPRMSAVQVVGDGSRGVWLDARLRTVVEATNLTTGQIVDTSRWVVNPVGMVQVAGALTEGHVYELVYTHGMDSPPLSVSNAIVDVAHVIARENVDSNAARRIEFADNVSWLIASADPSRGRLFGMPKQDAVFSLHRHEPLVA